MFGSIDEAAVDAITYTWEKYPNLRKGNVPELGGFIYKKEECFSYVEPVPGELDRMDITKFTRIPQGTHEVGYYHTHPSGDPGLSDKDSITGNSNGISAYAGYYDGRIYAGDPTGVIWDMTMHNEREISGLVPVKLTEEECKCGSKN